MSNMSVGIVKYDILTGGLSILALGGTGLSEAAPRAAAEMNRLTPQQMEVAVFISKGLNQEEIARLLHRSSNTIRTHRNNIFKRLGITKSTQLAVICTLAGLVTDWEAA